MPLPDTSLFFLRGRKGQHCGAVGEAAHTGVPVQGLPPPLPNQLPANVPQEAAVAQILGSLLNCPITARAGPGQTQRRELDPNLPIWVTGTQLLGACKGAQEQEVGIRNGARTPTSALHYGIEDWCGDTGKGC